MSIAVQCPTCSKRLTSEAGAFWILCPACGTRVQLEAAKSLQNLAPEESAAEPDEKPVHPPMSVEIAPRKSHWPTVLVSSVALSVGIIAGVAILNPIQILNISTGQPTTQSSSATFANQTTRPSDGIEIQSSESRMQLTLKDSHSLTADSTDQFISGIEISQAPLPRRSDFAPELTGEAPVSIGPPASAPSAVGLARFDEHTLKDAQVAEAIQRGVDYLIKQCPNGSIPPPTDLSPAEVHSLSALCVYALAAAGQTIPDQRIDRQGAAINAMLDSLCDFDLTIDRKTPDRLVIYGRSLRAAALSIHNREKDRAVLKADVDWLIDGQLKGFYSYNDRVTSTPPAMFARAIGAALIGEVEHEVPTTRPGPPSETRAPFPWENPATQYGWLGVSAGAQAGIDGPEAYWQSLERSWTSSQLRSGQWPLRKESLAGDTATTLAGVAALLAARDFTGSSSPSLERAFAWLNTGDNAIGASNSRKQNAAYDLFNIERIGLASGCKYLGGHDWYRQLSAQLLTSQNKSGAWGSENHSADTIVETAYAILFLSLDRHPVMMTQLKFDGPWKGHPREVAGLSRFAERELAQPLNWQIVDANRPWQDWFDSPVLFIASHQAPNLSDQNYADLRSFVQAGGLIFTQADASSHPFDRWVSDLAAKVAPGHALEPIPANDPVYSVHFKLQGRRLMGVRNGVRWLIVHSPSDVAAGWQQRSTNTHLADFQLGTNIFLYAAGKPEGRLRNRLESPDIPEPTAPPAGIFRVARLGFAGNWDPEPAAWERFSRYLQSETGTSLAISTLPAAKLTPGVAPLAALTGTGQPTFSDAEIKAVHDYVFAGGVLIIDPCGGDALFRTSVRETLINRLSADAKPMSLKSHSPLLPNSTELLLRRYTVEKLGAAVPGIEIFALGKGALIVSPRDITFGLLGTQTWGIDGYQPEAAEAFLKNVIEWVRTR